MSLPKSNCDIAVIYTMPGCSPCARAKQLLTENGYILDEREMGRWTVKDLQQDVPGARTVPQIIINGTVIGGLEKLLDFLGIEYK